MSTLPELARESEFSEILGLVAAARLRAVQAVNTTLIELYWQVGKYTAARSNRPNGAMAWLANWPTIWRRPSRG